MLAVATGALSATKFREDTLHCAASNSALLATEAADYLVRKGMPFRQAHDIVGKLLNQAERENKKWTELPLSELKKLSPAFEDDFSDGLNVEAALAAKSVPGGTARESVQAACKELEIKLKKLGAKP
jgi:argininosuccinate lyase